MTVLVRATERQGPDIRAVADAVKAKLRIEDVIGKSIELKEHGSDELVGWHTVHGSESKTSLKVSRDKQVYHCFNCGDGGDVLDWIGHQRFNSGWDDRGEQFVSLLLEVARENGVPFEESEKARRSYAERRQVEAVLTAATDYYHAQLPPALRQHLVSHYGLTEETIGKLHIGYAPVGGQHLHQALQAQGMETSAIAAAGLLIDPGGRGRFKDFFEGRLMFPYWQVGKVVSLIGRQTEHTPDRPWETGKYKKLLAHNAKHPYVSTALGGAALYGLDSLRGKTTCLLTEGVTDAIAAHQHGFPCLSPATIRFAKADVGRLLEALRDKTVYIVNDQEQSQAGDLGARDTAVLLWQAGVQAWLVSLPRTNDRAKIDLNEYLRDTGGDALRVLFASAQSPLDLALEEIEASPRAERVHALGRVRALTEPFDSDVLAPWADRLGALGIDPKSVPRVLREHESVTPASQMSQVSQVSPSLFSFSDEQQSVWEPRFLLDAEEEEHVARGIWLDTYQAYCATRTDAPAVFQEALGLVVLSSVVGRRAILRLAQANVVPNLWVLLVADSTVYRKSTSLDICRELIGLVASELLAPNDFTPQRFLAIMAENDSTPLVFMRDEFSGFYDGLNRLDYMANLKESLCDIYDGRPFRREKMKPKEAKRDRHGAGSEILRRATDGDWKYDVREPFLSIAAGTSMTRFVDVAKPDDVYSGFLPRWALVVPDGPPGDQQDVMELTDEMAHARETLAAELRSIRTGPLNLSCEREVFSRFNRYARELTADAQASYNPNLFSIIGDRISWMAFRIALLLAAAEPLKDRPTPSGRVRLPHLLRGIQIAESWRHTSTRVLAGLAPSRFERQAGRLVDLVISRGGGGTSRREAMRALRLSKRDMNDVEATVEERGELLVQRERVAGGLRVLYFPPVAPAPDGGRPPSANGPKKKLDLVTLTTPATPGSPADGIDGSGVTPAAQPAAGNAPSESCPQNTHNTQKLPDVDSPWSRSAEPAWQEEL